MDALWEHAIDGVNINDLLAFGTSVPEVQNRFGGTVLLSEMQDRSPIYNRHQPVAGRYTFLITPIASTDEIYLARMAVLRALVAPGPHTWVFKAPSEASSHTVTVYFDTGLITDDSGYGRVTARAVAPDPAFA